MARNPALTPPLLFGLAAALAAAALGGALLGGVLARAPAAPPEAARAEPAAASPPAHPDDGELARLLGVLIDEVRALRTSLRSVRQPAETLDPSGEPGVQGPDRLTAAIETLTSTLRSGGGGGFGAPGRGLTVIDFPSRAARVDLLLPLLDVEDDNQRVRPYLLWNYQQILDRFGPPAAIYDGERWMYEDPVTGRQVNLRFQYGLLTNIN